MSQTEITCCNCGITFSVPSAYDNKRRRDGATFYCPNSHRLSYTVGESEDSRSNARYSYFREIHDMAQAAAIGRPLTLVHFREHRQSAAPYHLGWRA